LHSSCTLRVVASMWLWCVTTRTGRPGEGQPSTALQCRLLTAVRPCGGRTSAAACNHRRRCCGEVSCHGNRKLLSCEISRSLGAHQGVGRDPQRPGARSGPHSAGMFVQFRGFNPPNHRQLCRSGTVAAPQGITVFAWVSVVNGPNRPASPSPATGLDRDRGHSEHDGAAVAASPPQRPALAPACARQLELLARPPTRPVVDRGRLGVRG